jgi:hypothetical protein
MAFPVAHKRGRLHLGNSRTAQVHLVIRARARCRVDEVIAADEAVGFYPDSLDQALSEGYDICAYCTGELGDR